MTYKQEFITFMVRSGVLTFGDFTTKSGRKTPYFVNTGNYKTGAQAAKLGDYYAACIQENLPEGITDYAYNVMVKRTKDFLSYTSNYSNTIEVKLISTDVEHIVTDLQSNTHKLLHNGRILIHRDGQIYTLMGIETK